MSMLNLQRYVETFGYILIRIEGYYTGRALKGGKVVREFGCAVPVPNLITDIGMNSFGTGPSFTRMQLGTGTTTPAFTDTALAVFGTNVIAANPSESIGNSGSAPYYGWWRGTWTSAVGGATGVWTEIGISNQNTTGNLRSRALILDGGGLPTSFPVLADEQFQGTYELRIYVPTADSPAAITLSGTPYDTVTRALNATLGTTASGSWVPQALNSSSIFQGLTTSSGFLYTGGLNPVTSTSPAGSLIDGVNSGSASAYVSGNFYLDSSRRWGSASGVGTVRSVQYLLNCSSFQIEYTPTFSKLTTQEFIHNQRVIWARR